MSYSRYSSLENSRRRQSWWRTNAPALAIVFCVAAPAAYTLDRQTNFVNIAAGRLTNTAPSKVPFAYTVDRYAERAVNTAVSLSRRLGM